MALTPEIIEAVGKAMAGIIAAIGSLIVALTGATKLWVALRKPRKYRRQRRG